MRVSIGIVTILSALNAAPFTTAQVSDIDAVRDDQVDRLKSYILDAIQPSGLVRDSLQLDPAASNFHPATPDAAGFALVGLSALDHLGKLPDAERLAVDILSAHAGQNPGVMPDRSADGHFIHFMDVVDGSPAGADWDDSYSPISSALLVAGAQFARNHFRGNSQIASLSRQLAASVNFNAAIHPRLDGRVYLDMTKNGGGRESTSLPRPWNEFALVVSLALREPENGPALAVRDRWLDVSRLPKRAYEGIETLTDAPGEFMPAFLVHQGHFLNPDFRHDGDFEAFFTQHQEADRLYSTSVLNQDYRYGLTAGVIPGGYHVDRIADHPLTVFSPEAVAAWGDVETMLRFYEDQNPASDPRYRYGLVRVSAEMPTWIPQDAALVDHLFLLFGLVESIDRDFFAERLRFTRADFDEDGDVDDEDLLRWQASFGVDALGDADGDGGTDGQDFLVWQAEFGSGVVGSATSMAVPEPSTLLFLLTSIVFVSTLRRRPGCLSSI